jgi:regulator of nucleoside diphosphate kinase
MTSNLQTDLPPIAITAHDLERLSQLAKAASSTFPRTADFLAREIERAQVVADPDAVPGLVVMNSTVEFRDDAGQTRRVTLVYPDAADVSTGKISVLTPIGAALIGLSVGQSIQFQTPSGGWRSLTVVSVSP